ncbi:MFS transporter [Paenibacillus sp. FSL W8-0426]|uniref:MFS transporter n=1 Tax=Paenibacillus sp. FSL W8-0426 TaxID=2921714 RepID=UPI0030D7F975
MDLRRNLPLLIVVCFLSQMGGFMILPLFPLFIDGLGLSSWTMGIIFAMFYVGKVIGGMPAAGLYRKTGGKTSLILMLLMLALCMAGFAMASSALLLGLLRLLQGLASTGLTVTVRSIIGDGGSEHNRGLYNGYISSSEGGGMVLGPVVSGWLALHFPPSVPFWLVTVCCLVAMLAAMAIRNTTTSSKADAGSSSKVDAAMLPAAASPSPASFTETDESANRAGLRGELTPSQQLFGYSLVHFLEMSAYAVFLTYFALYATHIMQWNSFSISLAFTVVGISTLAAAPLAGYLSDRMGDRLLLCMLGMLFIGVEVAVFLTTSSYVWVYLGMLIGGVGGACYMDSFFAHIGDHIPETGRSEAIGKIVSAAEIGSIVSPLIAALLAEAGSLYAVFWFNLALIGAAITVQAFMRKQLRTEHLSSENARSKQ